MMQVEEIEQIIDGFLFEVKHKHVADRRRNVFSDAEGFTALDMTYALMEFDRRYPCDLNHAVELIDSFTLNKIAAALSKSLK